MFDLLASIECIVYHYPTLDKNRSSNQTQHNTGDPKATESEFGATGGEMAKGRDIKTLNRGLYHTVLLQKAPVFTVLLAPSVLSVLLVVVILIGIVTIFGLGGAVVTFLVLFLLWTLLRMLCTLQQRKTMKILYPEFSRSSHCK